MRYFFLPLGTVQTALIYRTSKLSPTLLFRLPFCRSRTILSCSGAKGVKERALGRRPAWPLLRTQVVSFGLWKAGREAELTWFPAANAHDKASAGQGTHPGGAPGCVNPCSSTPRDISSFRSLFQKLPSGASAGCCCQSPVGLPEG